MLFLSSVLFCASRSSGSPVATIVILIGIGVGFILYFMGKGRGLAEGESRGRAAEREALSSRQRELDRANSNLSARESAAEKRIRDADARADQKLKHAETLEKAAATKLREAKQRFDEAYSEKEYVLREYEKQIRAIAQTCVSSHPNNAYIAEVWNGTCEAIIDDMLHDLNWRADKTAARIEKRFNSCARQWQYDAKYYKLQTLLYESLFPELQEYVDKESADTMPPEKTTDKDWLSEAEYASLSSTEKSQLALDRYITSHNKTKWQIGRDYELYIGYCYRRKGFRVEHIGLEMQLEDMGRDLICRRDPLASKNETLIVQCKHWSAEKKIHEKHITQLFGTTVEYAFAHGITLEDGRLPSRLKPVLITSTELSETARRFADALGVEYQEKIQLPGKADSFPRIKCNKGSGIFHLPFDEQYDVTKIVPSEGDCFAFTVAEAESKGFTRAKRHFIHTRSPPSRSGNSP